MKRVLITAPARQEPKVFKEYLEGIDRLNVPEGYAVDTFFVINNCMELLPLLRRTDAYAIIDTDDRDYERTLDDHVWTFDNILNMSRLRNFTIDYALENGYDYWFSVDTDIILHPDTLKWLIGADKDIISEFFFTVSKGYNKWCNAWMYDQLSGMPVPLLDQPGTYRCGMTGACMLVKRKVLESGVNYTPIPNIRYALNGEDRHFCVRAACAGFEMWTDTHCTPDHLYTEKLYNDYMKRKEGR